MNWQTYNIEVITPCFCAGANQQQAEIRVPSIRGQLRWWFRALGGTRQEEAQIFGGVHGGATASAVRLRVGNVLKGPAWDMFPMRINTPCSYIWYFASVADHGKRWWLNGQKGKSNPDGHLPPGTTFDLQFACCPSMEESKRTRFMMALEAFCRFGGFGLRLTRGMGAIACNTHFSGNLASFQKSAVILEDSGFTVRWRDQIFRSWQAAISDAEKWLKNDLRKEFNAKKQRSSPLGSDSPRQTSAVYFRPIRIDEGYALLIFEAPHAMVLSPASRRDSPAIEKRSFTGVAPVGNEHRNYRN